jgi:hypothetical protein
VSYPRELLRREVAFLALHVHWPYEVLMNLEHQERRGWVREVVSLLEKPESGSM